MKSGFLLSKGQQEEQKGGWTTKPSMGPLRDPRSNRVRFLWGAGTHNDENFVTEAQRFVQQERYDRDCILDNNESRRRIVVNEDVVMDDYEEEMQEGVKVAEEARCVNVMNKKEEECEIATSTDATSISATANPTNSETITSPTKKQKLKKKKASKETTASTVETCQVEVEEGEVEEEQLPSPTTTKTNPFANVPTLPHKTSGVPKNALCSYYSQRYKINLPNNQFQIRNDGGQPHSLKWTCQFICPITKEVFKSARYGSPQYYDVDDEGVVWYKQKKLAEHAAAGRALDCLMYRDFLKDSSCWRICVEEPYEVDDVQQKKLGLQKTDSEDSLIDNSGNHQPEDVAAMEDNEKEVTYREIYRMSRLGSVPNLGL